MAVPVLIFVACMIAGVFAAARWLPALEAGPVGGLAFFAVCGLIGGGVGEIGLHIYGIAETVDELHLAKGVVVASELRAMLYEAGVLFGLAVAVYLLAPALPEPGPDQ